MRTVENRSRYDRSGLRYPRDLSVVEWRSVEPLIPPAKKGGNKRSVDVREVVSGLMYVLSNGCQRRALPKDLAPRSAAYDHFARWVDQALDAGVAVERGYLLDKLGMAGRAGRRLVGRRGEGGGREEQA